MNYYNSTAINQLASDNEYTPTLLPLTAYNDYQEEFLQTFSSTIDVKHQLDSIVFSSISTEEPNSIPSPLLSAEQEILTPLTSDDETNNANLSFQPNETPLPLLEPPSSPIENESTKFKTAIDKLKEVANLRDDISDFIQYLSEKYNIPLDQEIDDLPFEVIDEIMAYIDYDPDIDGELEFDVFHRLNTDSDSDDEIIIPESELDRFDNLIQQLSKNVKRLKSLYRINGINDQRNDIQYHHFQQLFKPTIDTLIRLYRHNIKDYDDILTSSRSYHNNQKLSSIDWDAQYSDYDY